MEYFDSYIYKDAIYSICSIKMQCICIERTIKVCYPSARCMLSKSVDVCVCKISLHTSK